MILIDQDSTASSLCSAGSLFRCTLQQDSATDFSEMGKFTKTIAFEGEAQNPMAIRTLDAAFSSTAWAPPAQSSLQSQSGPPALARSRSALQAPARHVGFVSP